MDAPKFISMQGNLPVVDYSRGLPPATAIERCPTGAIVWLDPRTGNLKGHGARKIIRHGELPDAPT
jgi:electron transport complex protein RnfB